MAVTFLTGFEAAAVKVDGLNALSGSAAYSTAQARTGTRSIRCNPGSGVVGTIDLTGSSLNYTHFGLYIVSLPSVSRSVAGELNDGVRLTSTGTLEVRDGGSLVGTSAALSTGQWYWIGLRTTAATSSVILQINGVDAVTGTQAGTISPALGVNDTEASAIDIYIDDVIGDGTGFLAPSKVALLLPISDYGRSSTWTGGTGGTTNLWEAVNNTPPAGLATESNTSQIEHAGGGSGADFYSANMTTYTTAGVGASDTIIALQGLTVWGEDSATGAKLLSYNGDSNPAWTGETSVDVSTGDGSGATLNYAAGPPDRWNERRSAVKTTGLTIGADITLGTSPVMTMMRPETATRVASVCFMGMYVAWTPPTGKKYSRVMVIT